MKRLAPELTKSCGIPLAFRYFCTAPVVAVPSWLNISSTSSDSTSLRVISTVLGGE